METTFYIEKLDEGYILTQDGKKSAIGGDNILNQTIENKIKTFLSKETNNCHNALISIEIDTNITTSV